MSWHNLFVIRILLLHDTVDQSLEDWPRDHRLLPTTQLGFIALSEFISSMIDRDLLTYALHDAAFARDTEKRSPMAVYYSGVTLVHN